MILAKMNNTDNEIRIMDNGRLISVSKRLENTSQITALSIFLNNTYHIPYDMDKIDVNYVKLLDSRTLSIFYYEGVYVGHTIRGNYSEDYIEYLDLNISPDIVMVHDISRVLSLLMYINEETTSYIEDINKYKIIISKVSNNIE